MINSAHRSTVGSRANSPSIWPYYVRPRKLSSPAERYRFALRSSARRWLGLDAKITPLEQQINQLVRQHGPKLFQRVGIGTDTAAEILIVAGDHPKRITFEALLPKWPASAPCGPAVG